MKIGIVGYGKMGKDIFSLFFDKLPDAQFVVIDLFGAEENREALLKNLGKSLKRKKLTEEQYEYKKGSFVFTDDISTLSGCNIVIEAVFENMASKKELFAKAAQAVSDDCLLLTNTSSLDIASVFEDIPYKERCFGMHFFYPVKLTGFVELNVLPETAQDNIEEAAQLIESAGKKPIIFSGEYHIYLNQILACMISHAIYLRESLGASAAEIDRSLAELFPVAGPFEILDSVSLGLMAENPGNFQIERNRKLLGYGCEKMQGWLADGCPRETLCFLDFMSEHEKDTGADCSKAALYMAALILNETVNAVSGYSGNKTVLTEAVQDTLGLSESPAALYRKYGSEDIFAALDKLHSETGFGSYSHKDKGVWDSILG
ncbi:MAG: 3-hydroxyacyl-CoA dehydrogenase family protein [Ruminococcus sp.]|uniref:3-hydroxyacyl-CoA dehydrogenase family protein n=1 Tax=Ruminococcus sp. TaxID=41978 RepID=UPI001B2DC17B|nr:3-hydroxyacyl-CoA dehydrogenase family protein [Ruminococcus sp.]MBO7474878.1 3-hydroxyacyl-CoA dehydrogenase family protein [Ruminococcus sp.]